MPAYISHSLKAVRFKKRCIIQCFLNNTFFYEYHMLELLKKIIIVILYDIFSHFSFQNN